jgi:hypothetical protein
MNPVKTGGAPKELAICQTGQYNFTAFGKIDVVLEQILHFQGVGQGGHRRSKDDIDNLPRYHNHLFGGIAL